MNQRCGFNFQWMFHGEYGQDPQPVDLKALDFLAHFGFDFVRVPTSYWLWTKDFDYLNPRQQAFEHLDSALKACQERGIHMSLNSHRAPGYCINSNHLEKHNLWKDDEAVAGFHHLWSLWAERYKGVSPTDLSFDLLNEPPNEGEYGMTRDDHERVMRSTIDVIRAIDPTRPIVLNGIGGGHYAIPELADTGTVHSGRGYLPMTLSHQGAGWWTGWQGEPYPQWPGAVWMGKVWDKAALHELFEPWRQVAATGTPVMMGEFGCYNQVPNQMALAWLRDIMSIWKAEGWGWGMWNFEGAFGIIDHGREGAVIEEVMGYQVDRELLDLLLEMRIG